MHLSSLMTLFYVGLTIEREGETLTKFIEESSRRWFSYIDLSRGKTKKEMKDGPIIMDELYVLKDTMPKETTTRARPSIEIEAEESLNPLVGG